MSKIFVSEKNRELLAEFSDLTDEQYLPKYLCRFREDAEIFRAVANYARQKARENSTPKIYFRYLTSLKMWQSVRKTFREMLELAKTAKNRAKILARENAEKLLRRGKFLSDFSDEIRAKNREKLAKITRGKFGEEVAVLRI